jgi:SAM-dependent methyltransferase
MSMDAARFWNRLTTKVLPNLHWLPESRLRVCRCCQRLSVIVSLSEGEERRLCIRCRANLRYEMLADVIRELYPDLHDKEVLELDPRSPLRRMLSGAGAYHRSYYAAADMPGSRRSDGARCEDITRLTFPDASLDLIVSSDVLEHVPDLEAAFRETARVLRRGGSHLFTVPPHAATRRRAGIEGGRIVMYEEPEYHSDPLDPKGILAFWDLGDDLPERFSTRELRIGRMRGPIGRDRRVVWRAEKR